MASNSVDFYLSAENNLMTMSDHHDQSQQQLHHQQQTLNQQSQSPQHQQQQQSSTTWTNGTTTLSLVHQQGLHQQHHNPHHQQDNNTAIRSVILNGVGNTNCGYHQSDHHSTSNNTNNTTTTTNNGLGVLHLNGSNGNNPATPPTSINQTLSTPPSNTSSPISNHDRESPTLINGTTSDHKRYLSEYLADNGPVNPNSNNNLTASEPLPKKLHTNGKKTKGRVKIKMEFIDNKLRRYTTFSKRKSGIMKKAYELSTLTGTQVMLLVASETGHVYTFATKKLKPMITSDTGKSLIKTCLFSPEPQTNGFDPRMSSTGYEETELSYSVNDDSSEKDEEDSSLSSHDVFSSGTLGSSIGLSSNLDNRDHLATSSSSTSVALALTSTTNPLSLSSPSSSSSPSSISSSSPSPGLPSISFVNGSSVTLGNVNSTATSVDTQSTVTSSSPSSSSTSSSSSLSTSSTTNLPLKLTASNNQVNRSNLGLTSISSNVNNSNTGTTFTAAILGGILPSSALLNANGNYQDSHGTTGTINPTTLYKLPDFTASSLSDSRLSSKVTSPLFNSGSVVLCTNQATNNNGLMYHTPQGVVYATAASPNSMFPESLILNFGQNLSQAAAAAAAAAAAVAGNNGNTSDLNDQRQLAVNFDSHQSGQSLMKSHKSGYKKSRKMG